MTARVLVAAVVSLFLAGAAHAALDAGSVARAAEYSARYGEHSMLLWENGRVIFERGTRGAVPPPRIFSITKSLVSIGVFRDAMTGGLSLGQAAGGGAARGIALADLLNQTSGLAPAAGEFYTVGLQDKQRVLRGLKRNGDGSVGYGPSHWEVLAEEIRLRRGTPLEKWVRRFVPGARPDVVARWRKDDSGTMFFSTGARMDARDLLPAGREVVRGMGRGSGQWPAEVRALLSGGTAANRMYALGFWLNRQKSVPGAREVAVESSLDRPRPPEFWRAACLSLRAPDELLAMIGTDGQRAYVVPSRDLVVVRLGARAGFSDSEFLAKLFGP